MVLAQTGGLPMHNHTTVSSTSWYVTRHLLALTGLCTSLAGGTAAADTRVLPLGEGQPPATIIASAGLATDWAWASVQVLPEDAVAHCGATDRDNEDACTTEVLSAEDGRLRTIMADCSAGSLTTADRQSFSRAEEGAHWLDRSGTRVDEQRLDDYWTILCTPDAAALEVAERQAENARAEREAEIAMLTGALATMGPSSPPQIEAPRSVVVGSSSTEPSAMPDAAEAIQHDNSIVGIDHNGSLMWHDAAQGVLYYEKPKPALEGIVKPGTILFQGAPWSFNSDFRMSGTAYTFRAGCAPAAYQVEGGFVAGGNPNTPDRIVLRGASPIRERGGCAILGYTDESPNARLEFQLNYGEV